MSRENFVYTQSSIDIKRSKFLMNSFWKGSIYHGDLVPIEIIDCMPGDSIKYDISVFCRTATPPIAPFMDSIKLSIAGFLVPKRLVWDKEKQFLGEATEGYGIQTEVLAPRSINSNNTVYAGNAVTSTYARSIGTYLGLVRQKETPSDISPISVNPIRAYLQVYNDWFRNENFMDPFLWNHAQTGDGNIAFATRGGSNFNAVNDVPIVCKQLDRYTSCLPWAQKGSPVVLPLGSTAPVVTGLVNTNLADLTAVSGGTDKVSYKLKSGVYGEVMALSGDVPSGYVDKSVVLGVKSETTNPGQVGIMPSTGLQASNNGRVAPINLWADLSEATAASINELRLAFATQRYLEALARTGSKYREYIKGIFGVSIGDTTAQMAEYLGGMTMELNVDQVLQTTNYAAGGTTKLGAPGASSTSATSQYLFTKSVEEPSYLVIVAYTKHSRSYGQGISEIFQKHEILEEYNPKFANIGEQAIKSNNLYFSGEAADDDDRFGFQEAWSEYRHIPNKIIGALNPSNTSAYNFWSLADNYASKPTLNADFLIEDRTNIYRALSGGEASPDYFLDIKLNRTFVRPMPLFSIPGLIDHH